MKKNETKKKQRALVTCDPDVYELAERMARQRTPKTTPSRLVARLIVEAAAKKNLVRGGATPPRRIHERQKNFIRGGAKPKAAI